MEKLAVLGPQGTISEQSALQWMKETGIHYEICFYDAISKVIEAVPTPCQRAIVPIENALDGYVFPTFDGLLATGLTIQDEVITPVDFSFVAHTSALEDVSKIYAQFKTQGQCRKFIDTFPHVEIITTESNGTSLTEINKGILREGAIIPHHTLQTFQQKPLFVQEHITDEDKNFTRFVVIGKPLEQNKQHKEFKTTLAIVEVEDKPGALFRILQTFADRQINLTSIMSRPTREGLGQYHFFIDVLGQYPQEKKVKEAIDCIGEKNTVKILGSYPVAR